MIRLIQIAAFALLIAACAQVSVPMVPVPMTMQTFVVLLAGAWLGPVWGAAAVLVYLAAGALGLPVFSDGGRGVQALWGPTAGYLISFPIAAALAGWAGRKGWLTRPWLRGVGVFSLLHLLILALGAAWLARFTGIEAAVRDGAAPFLIGAVVKSALVVGVLAARDRFRRV
ncbi:MAG TPA: biotin transporter BioY [Brevundimonas sp.]|uniref:biotin transporter BioY n=1 Tax=Brevundimonas sp. TaxID=1871086 RepID=UPI00261849FA|nr:biotin transporter BioY [Brevundimonas sp.]HRO34283.1 biotin transporter BioY [Brevundimonas sp.]